MRDKFIIKISHKMVVQISFLVDIIFKFIIVRTN